MTGGPTPAGPDAVRVGRLYDRWPDGVFRVLVDRLWPRGVRREAAPWDLWLKAAAPSSGLRQWYHAQPEAYEEFCARYRQELAADPARPALDRLAALAGDRPLALLTARSDVAHSHVPILRTAVLERLAPVKGPGPGHTT